MKKAIGIIILGLILNGCSTPSGHVNTSLRSYKSPNIKILQSLPRNAEIINTVSVITCKYGSGDPTPTSSQISNLLTIEADKFGADGISNIRIYDPGTPLSVNCWSRLAGEATAFKYGSGGSNNVEIKSMIDDAKNTCKELGFEEGTEEFPGCALKLYSQSVELAAKQNQQVVMQPQSSGSNVITIYDPVRDSRALIRQGQRMLSGACTLGINC